MPLFFHKESPCAGTHTHQSITSLVAGRMAPRHSVSPQGVSANLATTLEVSLSSNTVGSRPLTYLSPRTSLKVKLSNDVPAVNPFLILFCSSLKSLFTFKTHSKKKTVYRRVWGWSKGFVCLCFTVRELYSVSLE